MHVTDRLDLAASMAVCLRVLDVGGGLMPGSDEKHPFVQKYRRIATHAKEYKVVDCQDKPGVDHVLDFNDPASIPRLHDIIFEYKPDLILCMETLEHVNCHNEMMREFAAAVEKFGTAVFISIPNNSNWLLNLVKKWRSYHILAFFEDIAQNFICQSELGKFEVRQIPCIGNYYWWWRLFYLCAFCQPMSWGFLIQKPGMRMFNWSWWPQVHRKTIE